MAEADQQSAIVNASSSPPLRILSSMATRPFLAALAARGELAGMPPVVLEAMGGVDAARRVEAGEPFDVVCLARDALQRLMTAGHLQPGSVVGLARSPMAVAVPAGAARPDVSTESALREAVAAVARAGAADGRAPGLGRSTGPSGSHLMALLQRWGLAPRVVLAPPGVPVAALLAQGQVALGFQQLSELQCAPGVEVLGVLPPGAAHDTVFAGAVARSAGDPASAERWLHWAASPVHAALRSAQGMGDA